MQREKEGASSHRNMVGGGRGMKGEAPTV